MLLFNQLLLTISVLSELSARQFGNISLWNGDMAVTSDVFSIENYEEDHIHSIDVTEMGQRIVSPVTANF